MILLPEWRVELHDKPWPDAEEMDDYWAISRCHDDYTTQKIHFPDESLEREPLAIEITVVHELLHALTRPWREQINSLAGSLSREAYTTLADARVHEEEQLVDRLARVLVAQRYGAQPYCVTSESEPAAAPQSPRG